MKKLFLASSFADVANVFEEFVGEGLKGKAVTFIPTASIVEEMTFYVDDDKEAFEKLGMIVDELEVSKASKEEIKEKLTKNDFIFVSGGNTFYLLQELKRSGADEIIIEQINSDKIYIGTSAGSVVLAPNIEYLVDMDDSSIVTLESFDGLNIVDFYPVPHYAEEPFADVVEGIVQEYDSKLKLCPINNSQVIIVEGDKIEVKTAN